MAGVLFLYTGKLLGRCMEKAPWVLTYADIGELAFGIKGRIIIAILLYSELYLTCVLPPACFHRPLEQIATLLADIALTYPLKYVSEQMPAQ